MPQALKQGWGAHRDLSGSAAADAGFVFCVFFAFFSVFFLSRESHKRARAVPPPHSPALSGRPPHAAVREGGGSGGRGPLGARGRHVSARPDLLWANGGARRAWNRRNGRAPPRPLPRASPQLTSRGPGP